MNIKNLLAIVTLLTLAYALIFKSYNGLIAMIFETVIWFVMDIYQNMIEEW